MDPTVEFIFLTTTIFTVVLLLRRVGQLERRVRSAASAPTPAEKRSPAAGESSIDVESATWAMLVSPVTVILSQCELAHGQRTMDPRLEIIEKQARRMRDLLERQPGVEQRIRSEIEEIDVEACIRAAVASYAGLALDRDVGVHLMTEPTPSPRTNARLLNRALRHLIRTAIAAVPEGRGDVTVAVGVLPAEGEPTHVGFAVADDGPGIEPARLVRILDPSIDEETEPSSEELGYSVVYALARAIGAELVMDSAPGTGTRATLKVPLAPIPAPTPTPQPTVVGTGTVSG